MKIENDVISFEFDPDKITYSLSHRLLGVGISDAGISFEVPERGLISSGDFALDGMEEKNDSAKVLLKSPLASASLNFSLKKEALFIRLVLHTDDRVQRIFPLDCRGGVNLNNDLRIWRLGYQTWSPSGSFPLSGRERIPWLGFIIRNVLHPHIGFRPGRGVHHLDGVGIILDPATRKSVLIGFISARRFLSSINLTMNFREGGVGELRAFSDIERIRGRDFEAETLMVAIGDDPHFLLESYLDLFGAEMGARKAPHSPTGWASWYRYFRGVSEANLDTNLDALSKLKDKVPIQYFELDDGFQKAIGDWFLWNDKFPSGPEGIAKKIAEKGFLPGIWIAPFIATRKSRLYREHPGWFIKNRSGRPLLASLNPMWEGLPYYALDLTHPEVKDYLKKVFRAIKEWGYRYVKIDFLFAALLRGSRHDPSATGVDAYRGGLKIIRETLGEDVCILCAGPFLPSVGLVDVMRIGMDVAPYWRSRAMRAAIGAPVEPACENCIRNILTRSALHQRLFTSDPDCLLVRSKKSRLSLTEIKTLTTAIFLSGGQVFLSDDMGALEKERLDILRAVLPPTGRAARAVDLFDRKSPNIYHLWFPEKNHHLVGLFNLSDRSQKIGLDLKSLGIDELCHVFEFWEQRYLGIQENEIEPLFVPSHGCLFLSIVPVADRPRAISTSFYMAQGALEVKDEYSDGKIYRAELELPGQRSGTLYIALPRRPPESTIMSVEVEFQDKKTVLMNIE